MAEIDLWLISAIFFKKNTHCECVLTYDGFLWHSLLIPTLRVRKRTHNKNVYFNLQIYANMTQKKHAKKMTVMTYMHNYKIGNIFDIDI
jgi:hypothetical protein